MSDDIARTAAEIRAHLGDPVELTTDATLPDQVLEHCAQVRRDFEAAGAIRVQKLIDKMARQVEAQHLREIDPGFALVRPQQMSGISPSPWWPAPGLDDLPDPVPAPRPVLTCCPGCCTIRTQPNEGQGRPVDDNLRHSSCPEMLRQKAGTTGSNVKFSNGPNDTNCDRPGPGLTSRP